VTTATVTLVSIGITPANPQVAVNASLQLTATGLFSNGSTQNLTNSVAWSSSSTSVVTVNGAGVAAGVSEGSATIQAVLGSVSSSVPLIATPSGLVAWWQFNDGTGATAEDSSGFGNNATLYNGVNWVSGQTGDAISANGVNQYASTPGINLSSTSTVTIAMWVNRTYTTAGGTVLLENSANYNSTTTGFGVFPDDPGCDGIMAALQGNAGYSINCFAQPSSGIWHNLAFIYDKTQPGNNQVKFYLDGVQQVPTVNEYTSTNTNAFGDNQFFLFARGGTTGYASGEMDDLRVYNRGLTAAEIEQIYTIGAGNSNATLESISVTPANYEMVAGQTQQFTATGAYNDGGTENLTSAVTWSSSNPAVVTVNSNGVATSSNSGSATITASAGSISGTTNVSVVPMGGQFVQWASNDNGATSASTTYQDHNATAGDLVLVFAHWDNQALTATAADQLGNTYTPAFSPACPAGTTSCFQVWYASNVSSGAPIAATVTFSGTTTSISTVDLIEYSGVVASSPLDVSASAMGNSNFQNSGNMPTTTASNELIVGLVGYAGYATPYAAGAGFTFVNYDASTFLENRSVATTGVYGATASSAIATNWAAFVMGFKYKSPLPPGLTLSPVAVTAGNTSIGTVILNSPAPVGGAQVTLSSSNPSVASVPPSVTIAAGATSGTFNISTTSVTFSTTVSISATYGAGESATLTVTPTQMSQIASDNFNRANSPTLGSNWTPLIGQSTNVAFQVVGDQIEPTSASPSIAKELFYGGINWTPDQYSQVQIIAAGGGGNEGPAVRMTSSDTHYACTVASVGPGNAQVSIILDNAGSYTTLASSSTATVAIGDLVRCTVQGTILTMTDQTSSTTLLTSTDATLPSGFPGLMDNAGSGAVTSYVMANWSGGVSVMPLSVQQYASDNFNRPNALNLGVNWVIGTGHGPIQIVNDQIEPYPAGGPQPSKEHYIAYGPFPSDQWSQLQVVAASSLGDMVAEVRASDTADDMYICDVNLTGAPGVAETRIVKATNGILDTLIVDQQWSSVNPGDYVRGQVQGSLISLIDVTSGTLLLTIVDSTYTSGYPGISLQALSGNPANQIATNWSGGGFH